MGYQPITLTHSGGQVQALYEAPEAATQTFKPGTPLRIVAGFVAAADSVWAAADIIIGFSKADGQNLTVSGIAEDGISVQTPIGIPGGKIIPVGAPIKNGRSQYTKADALNVFSISLQAGQVFTQALVIPGTAYGLNKDATTGYWYIDSTDTVGNNAVAEIINVDPSDATKVRFRIIATRRPA